MAIIRKKELAGMTPEQMRSKLVEVETELYREIGTIRNGGRAQSPGRIKELKRTVARLKTLLAKKAEKKKEEVKKVGKPTVKKEVKPSA